MAKIYVEDEDRLEHLTERERERRVVDLHDALVRAEQARYVVVDPLSPPHRARDIVRCVRALGRVVAVPTTREESGGGDARVPDTRLRDGPLVGLRPERERERESWLIRSSDFVGMFITQLT